MLTGRCTVPSGVVFTLGDLDHGHYPVVVSAPSGSTVASLEKSSSGHWLLCGPLPAGVCELADVEPFEDACDRAEAEA